MSKHIDKLWNDYATTALKNIPQESVQFTEMRRSFHSGMTAMFYYLIQLPEESDEPTENDLSAMDEVDAELRRWALEEMAALLKDRMG